MGLVSPSYFRLSDYSYMSITICYKFDVISRNQTMKNYDKNYLAFSTFVQLVDQISLPDLHSKNKQEIVNITVRIINIQI